MFQFNRNKILHADYVVAPPQYVVELEDEDEEGKEETPRRSATLLLLLLCIDKERDTGSGPLQRRFLLLFIPRSERGECDGSFVEETEKRGGRRRM